jgi:DivIVA domain-containing protein
MSAGTSGERSGRTDPITPHQIRSVTFRPSSIAWRGYAGPEVKQLLDAAADALQEAREESVGLAAEIDRLRNF